LLSAENYVCLPRDIIMVELCNSFTDWYCRRVWTF